MSTHPNILLVTIDSLRADFIHGIEASTPSYDQLGDDGIKYRQAFAQGPFTTFSMPSLFTSRYPSSLGYLEFSDQTVGVYIEDEPTLPEVLQRAGYETAGFHSNPLLSNLFGFDRGFDTFDARLPLSNTDALSGRMKILADKLLRLIRKHAYLPAEKLNERAIDWVDARDDDSPFFLWLHYMDVHGPYTAKRGSAYLNKYRGERLWRKAVKQPESLTEAEHEQLRQLYKGEVEYTDDCLGELTSALRDRGLFDETVVAVTADHGEQFREHGYYSHPHQLYDELTHVPLIIRDPGGSSTSIERPVGLIDLAPELGARAGAELPASFTGQPLEDDAAANDTPTVISEADLVPAYNASVRTATHRYIRDEGANTVELYDHREDPDEKGDVSDEQSDVLNALAKYLDAHIEAPGRAAGPDRDVTQQEITDTGVEDRLQDLGYLQ